MRILSFSFLVIAISACVSCAKPDGNEHRDDAFVKAKNAGSLNVGYVVLAPWVQKDAQTGSLSGEYIDLINEIGRQSNLKIHLVESTWSNFAAGLNNGSYDISIVPSYITIQRATALSFTRPISYLGNTAIVRADDSRFQSVYDLNKKGVRIAVLQGEQGDDFARANLPDANVSALTGGDFNLEYTQVLNGRVDAALGDVVSIQNFVRTHPELRDIAPNKPYNVLPISWTVRYGDAELRSFLDSSIQYLHSSGLVSRLHEKWNVPGSEKAPNK